MAKLLGSTTLGPATRYEIGHIAFPERRLVVRDVIKRVAYRVQAQSAGELADMSNFTDMQWADWLGIAEIEDLRTRVQE